MRTFIKHAVQIISTEGLIHTHLVFALKTEIVKGKAVTDTREDLLLAFFGKKRV